MVGSDPPLAFVLQPPSGLPVMAKIGHSISKTALLQEIQLYAYVAGRDPLAAAIHHRHDEQMSWQAERQFTGRLSRRTTRASVKPRVSAPSTARMRVSSARMRSAASLLRSLPRASLASFATAASCEHAFGRSAATADSAFPRSDRNAFSLEIASTTKTRLLREFDP